MGHAKTGGPRQRDSAGGGNFFPHLCRGCLTLTAFQQFIKSLCLIWPRISQELGILSVQDVERRERSGSRRSIGAIQGRGSARRIGFTRLQEVILCRV